MAIIKGTRNKCQQECGEKETRTVDGNVNWYSYNGKQYENSSKKVNKIDLPYDPVIPFLSI